MAIDKKGILARARAAARETTAVTDEGLRAYMLKVYNYMATGILLTGIVALLTFKMSVVTNDAGSIVGLTQMGNAIYLSGLDRKSTRLNSSHSQQSRMPSSA